MAKLKPKKRDGFSKRQRHSENDISLNILNKNVNTADMETQQRQKSTNG